MESAPFLLSHVPAVVQTVTDWNAVWVGAGATFLGAMLGAGIGAWGSYVASSKAGYRLAKRAKLEEALGILNEHRERELSLVEELLPLLRRVRIQEAGMAINKVWQDLDPTVSRRLATLIEAYFSSRTELVEDVRKGILNVHSTCKMIRRGLPGDGSAGSYETLRGLRQELSKNIDILHDELVRELRKQS